MKIFASTLFAIMILGVSILPTFADDSTASAPSDTSTQAPKVSEPIMAQEASIAPEAAGSMNAMGAGTTAEGDKPIQVTGQSRNLSMLMVLKGEKDNINFLNLRKNYREEVPQTLY